MLSPDSMVQLLAVGVLKSIPAHGPGPAAGAGDAAAQVDAAGSTAPDLARTLVLWPGVEGASLPVRDLPGTAIFLVVPSHSRE